MATQWIEIRDGGGRLLFKYNPADNEIEIKRGGNVYQVIKLDEIRTKYGYVEGRLSTALGAECIDNP